MKQLINIQSKLVAPKGQFNDFGKYKYRNCEDILEALKPLLAEQKCVLTLSDEVRYIDGRWYVEATATIINDEGKTISVKALARETDTKKGMDESQITGATSSYARKYALNGLFCIDDSKDADSMTPPTPQVKPEEAKPQEPSEIIFDMINQAKDVAGLNEIWKAYPLYQRNQKFKNAMTKKRKEHEANLQPTS